MSAAIPARPDAGAPHHAAPTSDVGTRVREELARAEAHLADRQAEYDLLLADPDTIQEDRDAAALLLEHARHQLEAATAAVAQLDAGEYGRCTRCGGDIGAERLAALVDVTTCVTCAG